MAPIPEDGPARSGDDWAGVRGFAVGVLRVSDVVDNALLVRVKMAAVISLTVVLPQLPVMAIRGRFLPNKLRR